MGASRDRALARLAARQFSVVTYEQLLGLGFTANAIMLRVRRGVLHRLYRGVYVFGDGRVSGQGRLLAAQLTCGPGAFLSHRTAAAIWGLRAHNSHQINVTVPGKRRPSRSGLVLHCTRQTPEGPDVTTRTGLRVSSVPRMLVELATTEAPPELDRLITEAVRRSVLDLTDMEAALERHHRRPGVIRLRAALAAYHPHPDRKSGLERAFDDLIRDTDIPEPQRNVFVGSWELDCYWPEYHLAVELDGRPYHLAVRDQEKDKYKDGKLLLLGIHVLRITEFRLSVEPAVVRSDVRALTVGKSGSLPSPVVHAAAQSRPIAPS